MTLLHSGPRARRGALVVLLAAAALAPLAAPAPAIAQVQEAGPYVFLTGGRTNYDVDCGFWSDCDQARGDAVKLGGGWRFGTFGVEAWTADFGRGRVHEVPVDSLRMRSSGINAVWFGSLGPSVTGIMRVGGAEARHERTGDRTTHGLNPVFGLAMVAWFSPNAGLEVAWDMTRADGHNTGTTVASSITVGLRLRF